MLNLQTVTVTGADDSIDPQELERLSEEFPFFEWGILMSTNREGTPRYPTSGWVEHLHLIKAGSTIPMKLALHLCGQLVYDLLGGIFELPLRPIWPSFDRVQINFRDESVGAIDRGFVAHLKISNKKQWIFQVGRRNEYLLDYTRRMGVTNLVPLFDSSAGSGTVPNIWRPAHFLEHRRDRADGKPIFDLIPHGYAGGLGPDNLDVELPRIEGAAQDGPIWIDMETKVRAFEDHQFDLQKVRRVLMICEPLVNAAKAAALGVASETAT